MSEVKEKITAEEQAAMELVESNDAPDPDYRHTFSKPFTWYDKKYTTLDFNFGKLTGRDALAIYSELRAKGVTVLSPKYSPEYQMCLASRACGLGLDAFEAMPLWDFEKIIGKTKGFIPTVALL